MDRKKAHQSRPKTNRSTTPSARAIGPAFREPGNMNEHHYGTHLIKFKADRTPDGAYWIGKAHVQYNQGKTLRCFEVHGPAEKFDSKKAAEQHVLALAKTLIDSFI
jgi:hypothetical protein